MVFEVPQQGGANHKPRDVTWTDPTAGTFGLHTLSTCRSRNWKVELWMKLNSFDCFVGEYVFNLTLFTQEVPLRCAFLFKRETCFDRQTERKNSVTDNNKIQITIRYEK